MTGSCLETRHCLALGQRQGRLGTCNTCVLVGTLSRTTHGCIFLYARRPRGILCHLTFHVRHTSPCANQAIRAESDGASLVLLDEVGTGTDPVEGSALGLALLRALVRGGFGGAGFVVATTHHRCGVVRMRDAAGVY